MKTDDYTGIAEWDRHFGDTDEAWLALSNDGRVRQFNPAAVRLLGTDAATLAGTPLPLLLRRPDNGALQAAVAVRGRVLTLADGPRAGALIALEDVPCPLPGWQGRLVCLTDVSEWIAAEDSRVRKLDRLTALADIMTLAEADRQHWLDQAMELGARALGLELGMVNRIHDDVVFLMAHNAPGILRHGQSHPLDQTYCSLTVEANDVLALSPVTGTFAAERPCFRQFGYQSYIGVPLVLHGALYGTVCFCSRAPHPTGFDLNDRIFVKLLARWVGGVIERMNVESRLRESHGELEEQVELLAMAEKVARLGHWRLDIDARSLLLSGEAQAFLGLPARDAWGLGEFEALIAADDRAGWRDQINACADDGVPIGLELRITNADGYTRWLSLRGMRLESRDRPLLFGVMLDITDSKQAQETILFQASHDALTGLINRVLLFDRLGQEIRRCERADGRFAVLFIDLDYFKVINDRYGHEAGDRVLVQVARRLAAALRKSDTVARFGGDEFIALVPGGDSRERIAPLCEKILHRLEAPIPFGRESLFISASIGAAFFPSDATAPQDLIRLADNDMYRIKELRRHLPSPLRPQPHQG